MPKTVPQGTRYNQMNMHPPKLKEAQRWKFMATVMSPCIWMWTFHVSTFAPKSLENAYMSSTRNKPPCFDYSVIQAVFVHICATCFHYVLRRIFHFSLVFSPSISYPVRALFVLLASSSVEIGGEEKRTTVIVCVWSQNNHFKVRSVPKMHFILSTAGVWHTWALCSLNSKNRSCECEEPFLLNNKNNAKHDHCCCFSPIQFGWGHVASFFELLVR